jgi:hypothetical protein
MLNDLQKRDRRCDPLSQFSPTLSRGEIRFPAGLANATPIS